MARVRSRLPDIAIIILLFVLPLTMFWQQTLGGRTLLPTENLYQYEPYRTFREVVNAPEIPHNHLLSDMALQNVQWKSFIREQLAQGEIPLWNPHQFSGIPFLAAGQHSALYPPSLIYYVLTLTSAYGWFIVVNLWLAGVFMFAYLRSMGIGRGGSTLGGIVYQLAGFMIASAVFPMIVGSAVWLPLLLLMAENIIRRRPLLGRPSTLPWIAIGAVGLGFNILAGHVEITIYTLIILAYVSAGRLLHVYVQERKAPEHSATKQLLERGFALLGMVVLGVGLASIQFIPLFEFVQTNWRAERASLETVLGYAHAPRDMLQYLLPNLYGSPAMHSYLDVFTMEIVTDLRNLAGEPINFIDWGIKNYVEGALFVGVLPLILAGYAVVSSLFSKATERITVFLYVVLGCISLTFMFGLPTYALMYALPGINQLNSPFRWVFGVTVAVAVLSAIGMDKLAKSVQSQNETRSAMLRLSAGLVFIGSLLLISVAVSPALFNQLEPTFQRIVESMALANQAFADGRAFYNFLLPQLLVLGIVVLSSGIALWLASRRWRYWQILTLGIVVIDLLIASWGFNPASDSLLLDFVPPAVEFLQGQEGDWRYTTLEHLDEPPILNANTTMMFGLDDVRGYDSIIPKQYMDYMRALQVQYQADFNRIAPVPIRADLNPLGTHEDTIDSPLFHLLNIRYVVADRLTNIPYREWDKVYGDEAVVIWENPYAVPRAYTVLQSDFDEAWLPNEDGAFDYAKLAVPENLTPITITLYSGREKFLDIQTEEDVWLVISESYSEGWRAFVRPLGAGEAEETPYDVELVLGNFQGVELPSGDWTVRLVYSPASFQIGLFGSVISLGMVVFLLGVWFWRTYVGVNTEDSSTAAKVARNSIAPIILNLFNRGIDFAFAIVMLRILSPEDVGIYYYAVIIFVWFDIFNNFGLDLFLIREASRAREQAGYYFYNTTVLRVMLSVIGIPLLIGFLLIRQATVDPALPEEALVAIGLLYLGLFPASLSKGMTSLFYAYEQAEKPAAIATITTINKAIFGVVVLLLGYGIVGLAGVSILNNLITFAVLVYAGRGLIGRLINKLPDRALMWGMIKESAPLMLNHFLAHIFFQVDIVILEVMKGAVTVAQYSVAYRWLLAINIIPAFFTQALLPVMSRQAQGDREALKWNVQFGIKFLVILALPLAVGFTFLAEPLTFILGGAPYLPNGAIALQLMIWSIPIGWMNSLVQYVLVAMNMQRQVTRAFFVAVLFNIIANIIFIPQFGFQAAAIVTIFSEIMLFIPFVILAQRGLGSINIVELLWRPVVATAVMIVMTLAVSNIHILFGLVAGSILYVVVLVRLRPLTQMEVDTLLPMLPARLQASGMVRAILGYDMRRMERRL